MFCPFSLSVRLSTATLLLSDPLELERCIGTVVERLMANM